MLRPGGVLVVLDMVAHDREDWARSMGHSRLGFAPRQLEPLAADQGITLAARIRLPPSPTAEGPPLFVTTGRRAR